MVEKQMKTFNVGDTRYIVTDAEAREDIGELQDALSPLEVSAESEDVGKALKAKTISGGKVTEYELGYAAIIDDTLSVAGEAADAKETGDAIADLDAAKVNKPTTSPNGTSGQLLRTNGDGTTTWVDQGLPTDQQTADAVEAWLDDHPEATTTVQDGAITRAKLDSNLQGAVDDVDDLRSQMNNIAGITQSIVSGVANLNFASGATAFSSSNDYRARYFPVISGYNYTYTIISTYSPSDYRIVLSQNEPANGIAGEIIDTISAGASTHAEFTQTITYTATSNGYLSVVHYRSSTEDAAIIDMTGHYNGQIDTISDAVSDLTSDVGDLIIVSDTQPVSEDNELWIQETNGSEVEVPDIDEFNNLKSQTDVLNENALIIAETPKAFNHDGLETPKEIVFYGNEHAFSNACYADGVNYLNGNDRDYSINGIRMYGSGLFRTVTGTPTTSNDAAIYLETLSLLPGDYLLKISIDKGNSVIGASKGAYIYLTYTDNTDNKIAYTSDGNGFDVIITADKPVKAIRITLGYRPTWVFDGFKVWFGLFDTSTSFFDTGIVVPSESTVAYTPITDSDTICTMQHESVVKYPVNTKSYVDEHTPDIIGYWTDRIYVLPEDFGAVGDGVTDDSAAISDCLAYAKAHGKAVKGFLRYKTSDSVVLDWRYADVYLREINYTGNDYAVEIQNRDIAFGFHRIVSANAGVNFSCVSDKTAYAYQCQMTGNEIHCEGDCITAQPKTLYNVCEIKTLWSSNGNCIAFVNVTIHTESELGYQASEYVFRDCRCHCPNGYVAKYANATKMYNFTVESDCKYGLLDPRRCACYGWRHNEQADGMWYRVNGNSNYNNGSLIIFDTPSEDFAYKGIHNLIYESTNQVPWYAIDATAIQGFDEITASQGESLTGKWLTLAYTGVPLGTPVAGIYQSQGVNLGEKTYVIGNNIVHAPGQRRISSINVDCDFRVLDSREDSDIVAGANVILYMGTDFVIDTPHADIYFNASFGAVGYNDLTVTQHDGNTCTIYDKLGDVLFDGTNAGNGKWSLKCTIDLSAPNRAQGTVTWKCYDGTNEVWEVTKIS